MLFDWDQAKNESNQANHDGIDFDLASLVFDDPNFLIEEDHVTEEGEERLHAIGTVNGLTMLVVHTYRKTKDDKEIVRIISARAASKKEFKRYFQQAAK